MRAESESTVSSSRTGTAACKMIGPASRVFVHEMHRAAREFHAVLERLALRFESRESGQQRGMNIQDAAAEFLARNNGESKRM